MSYYGQGLDSVARGLKSIAEAMERASKTQGTHINYNIIVNVGPDTDKEEVANSVTEAIQRIEEKRAQSQRRN